ncbi:MAG: SirB2 family protein [Gammaproteobacteria bacterium]|nr:SirB2 family protein [Gammaproteobacteria bacterium]
MIEFYPQIRSTHVTAVLLSGGLFALRFAAVVAGFNSARSWPVRYLSYTIDTVLLTAALMLATLLHQYPFVHGWLTAKVLLLVAYIGLGAYAINYARDTRTRAVCGVSALFVFATIITVARTRHPFGVLASLMP